MTDTNHTMGLGGEEIIPLERQRTLHGMLTAIGRDGLIRLNAEGVILQANSQLAITLNTSVETLTGSLLSAWTAPESQKLIKQYLCPVGPAVCGVIPELTLRSTDGELKTFLVTCIPDQEGAVNPSEWYLAFLKSNIEMKFHKAVLAERNLLRKLLDNVPSYVFAKDRYGRFIVANRAFQKMNGCDHAEDILGKTDAELYSASLAASFRVDDHAVMASGKELVDRFERFATPTGIERRMITFKAPLYDEDGKVSGVMGASRDVTDLQNAEEALHASEELFRLILENSHDIAYSVDLRSGNITYVSPATEAVLGYYPGEMMNAGLIGWIKKIHRDDRKRLIDRLRSMKAPMDKGRHDRLEYRFRNNHNEYQWISQSSTVVIDKTGMPVAEVGTLRDITSYKQAEEAVRKAHRMEATATLAGGIAHKFNNLMVGVLGSAELLQSRHHHNPQIEEQITTIVRSAQEASSLARRMLAYAQGGKYNPIAVNLNKILDETLGFQRASFPPTIQVKRQLDPALWNTKADASQISQVIMDLTSNAIESMMFDGKESTGSLRVITRNLTPEQAHQYLPEDLPIGPYICMSIEDSGVGMNAALLQRIFDPFFTTKTQGRGLGLASAYGIVKNHFGYIEVTSEEGVGSRFCVFLPAVLDKVTKTQIPVKNRGFWTPSHAAHTGEVLLLVDDDDIVRNVTREILERLGYHVLVAEHGADALNVARKYKGEIHLALLDMSMPVMSGAEAFPLLKAERPSMKIIIVSGFELDPVTQSVLDAGAVAFLHKPFRMDLLATQVRTALEA